jgi:hypothetical protein
MSGSRSAPLLTELKGAGMSARRMAAELTTRGIATPSGGRWHAQTVLRMIDRAGSAHTHCDNGVGLCPRDNGVG